MLISGTPGQARLLGIPTEPFEENQSGSYSLGQLKSIVIDQRYTDTVDNTGQTLIPPTLESFVHTFSEDLVLSLGLDLEIKEGEEAEQDSIFVTIGNSSEYKDAAGRSTSEGYSLDVTSEGIAISGASPLGAWWATRSVLQQAVLGDLKFPYGSGSNAPGWGSRGFMVSWPIPFHSASGRRRQVANIFCKAWRWTALVPSRVFDRSVFLSIVLQAEYFPAAHER